jgi:hypothetical protein
MLGLFIDSNFAGQPHYQRETENQDCRLFSLHVSILPERPGARRLIPTKPASVERASSCCPLIAQSLERLVLIETPPTFIRFLGTPKRASAFTKDESFLIDEVPRSKEVRSLRGACQKNRLCQDQLNDEHRHALEIRSRPLMTQQRLATPSHVERPSPPTSVGRPSCSTLMISSTGTPNRTNGDLIEEFV